MTSKSKSKNKQNTHLATGKDGTPWIVDENGKKIKKVRKKVRRRASIGHAAPNDNSQSSFEFATSNSMSEFRIDRDESTSGYDTSGKKMMSFRTEATEMSTSHHSSSRQGPRSLDFRSPKTKTPKKSKKSKSLKSVDNETWWHIDDDIKERRIVKKSSKDSKDRLSQTDHGPSSASVMTPVSSKKKKKKSMSKSKSVRHVSSQDLDYDSGPDSPIGTVNTTGTGSIRSKPRRLKSQPDMSLEFNDSGDLDMLMSQSVHDHVRKPASAKPKLGKSKTTLGKIGKKLGKSCKALSVSSRKLNMSSHNYGKDRDSSPSRSNHSGTQKSIPSRAKPLPKDIKDIDGVLWRVDEFGNKRNKVRRKSKSNNGTGWSSGDESHVTYSSRETQDYNYSNKSMPTWSSDDGSGDSFSTGRRRTRPPQRRNSLGSVGAGSVGSAGKKPDSEKSIYVDLNDSHMRTPKRGTRSKSMSHGVVESPAQQQQRRGSAPGTPGGAKKEDTNDVLVQNLQHRLKNSEKEVARLCRVTMDQQDKMEDSKRELKKMRGQLTNSNHDKQALMMELDGLKLQIEKRKDRSNKSLEVSGGATTQELVEQLCDLEDDKEALEKELASERALCKQRLLAKEEEVRFLQEELERMRAEQGEKQLAYMQKRSVSDEDESMYSFNSSANKSSPRRHGHSMQFVGKILGNHLKDKAETEVALQKEDIRNLQDRVFQLQQSNEKLTKELKQATLEIKDDDDEEMRFAKEAAMKAASLSQPTPKKDLKAKVMSLSRRHRSNSDCDDNSCLSLSFRGGVGDCVRNGRSTDVSISQSFRHDRPQGLY
eukprot:CAMPEP_0116121952 /NCGR_PEP_ID=MMETSP0329-20121206/3962_1 /TAXON_ID=697910 /ORGANISM="Pseudo-nitzschia arenysensis, Strain B593" /LENGTH=815 /DNA_ID=CAMNT_0003615781 /DNA_START=247 /DNA_END=2695 /DNA_ORIENTATION=-